MSQDFFPARLNPSLSHIFNVSELTRHIKKCLEEKFPFIWVTGEISNFRMPLSGHGYFTLKDDHSQISAVIFKSQAAALKFKLKDGMSIVGLGRISVYEPRGTYQLIFEYLEPRGVGSLQIAFEQLKQKLSNEGLFDAQTKKNLPHLPQKISVITSPTGAAVRDFLKIARHRFENLPIEIVPVSVQGDAAPSDLIRAIEQLNAISATDIIVLARGGGSIEDLQAFNHEGVAQAIFASHIPVVSAVGHETDFTIADFVADLRAPTPSAAAEMVIPKKTDLIHHLDEIREKLYKTIFNSLILKRKTLESITHRMVHPRRRLQDSRLRLDDLSFRLDSATHRWIARRSEQVAFFRKMLTAFSPLNTTDRLKNQIAQQKQALSDAITTLVENRRSVLTRNCILLEALSPMAILSRGYSITRTLPQQDIVRAAAALKVNQPLEILLASGRLTVRVDTVSDEKGPFSHGGKKKTGI